ncbi:MAG: hypothetical protein KDA28_01845, partial [Phycisphaerales bacterium]|nr:hypothetical protein [Phycisphaerales bacterium]
VSEPMTDDRCILDFIAMTPPHWVLAEQETTVTVQMPGGSAVTDVFEITLDGDVVDAAHWTDSDARALQLRNVELSQDVPVRLFVLAADADVRAEVVAVLDGRP